MLKWVLRIAAGLGALLVALPLFGFFTQAFLDDRDMRRLPPPGAIHQVNGRSLHISCLGVGAPTLVIDAGAGSWSTQWSGIQAQTSQATRTCVYDRAGLGWSRGENAHLTGRDYADDLRSLLAAAGERPPYILAGHSYGGYLVRIYRDAYPDDVAALILIDAAHEEQWTRFPTALIDAIPDARRRFQLGEWMSRFGLLRLMGPPSKDLPSAEQSAQAATIMATARFMHASRVEFEAGLDVVPPEVVATGPLGDTPLLVITAALSAETYCTPSPTLNCDEVQAVWNLLQGDLLSLSTNSRQAILQDSSHAVYVDAPEAVATHLVQFVEVLRDDQWPKHD